MSVTRMGVLGLALVIVAGCGDEASLQREGRALTVDSAGSGIEHVVVVMMENRSFDHLLGRWGLEPLTVRDQTANNLVQALDFTCRRAHVPRFSVPAGPFGAPCRQSVSSPPESADLGGLAALATRFGWPIGDASPATIAALLRQVGAAP